MTPIEMEVQRLLREVKALQDLREENEMLRYQQKLDMSEISRLRRQIEALEDRKDGLYWSF